MTTNEYDRATLAPEIIKQAAYEADHGSAAPAVRLQTLLMQLSIETSLLRVTTMVIALQSRSALDAAPA